MKQMYLNKINSQERFENGPKTVRVKSRIGSRLVRKSLDSFLTRFCLISLFLILMGGFTTEVWGNTVGSANSSNDVQNGKIVMGGNHATFTFTASGTNISNADWPTYSYQLGSIDHGKSKECTFTWVANGGCSIKVTKIEFGVRGYTSNIGRTGEMKAVFNGETKDIGSILTSYTTFSETNNNGFSSGIKLTLKNTCGGHGWISKSYDKFDYYIGNISITYTITPNKPGVSPTTETVDVTLPTNTANPTTINYQDNFSTSDHYGSYFEYAFDSNPNNKGVMSGSNFYATEAGTYKIKARIKALTNCHEASSWSSNLTITVNPLTPSFNAANGSVDISYTGSVVTTDLRTLISGYNGNSTSLTFTKVSASNGGDLNKATIASDGYSFSATQLGTYTLKATYGSTKQYSAVEKTFTITVGKRTPTFSWWNEDGTTHIYAGDVLTNVAQAQYNGNDVTGLTYSYDSSDETRAVVDGTTIRVPSTGFTVAGTVTITVKTVENSYYKKGEDTHDYYIEPKATPEFWLNETTNLPETPVQPLNLLIGETATMSFVNTDESNGLFTYPTNPSYVSYAHSNHTGVITGTIAGDEEIQFHQTGTATIFDHLRKIHVYVSKHPVNLATTLNGGTWKVDSIYDGAVYSIVTPTDDQPELSEVTVTSSNEAVLKKVDGHWKAVGEGVATLTISHPSTNAYWAGQTVTATITVVKHTPVITWNLDASYPWGAIIESPVSSSNEELPFTVESNHSDIANYVNGRIEVYNKVGSATFTLTQEGNYKWSAANANLQFTINSFKPQNHLPMNLTAGNYSHYKSYVTSNVSWANSGVQCGTAGGGFNWDDKYIELHFTGVPNHLTFNYKNNNNVVGDHSGVEWFIQTKTENGEWSSKQTWSDDSGSKDFALSPDVSYVRLCYSGNYGGLFTNIKVTERREVVAKPTSLTYATADVDASAQTLPVQIDWYNVMTCTATIEGANAGFFQLAETAQIAASLNHYGTETLHVTYAYPQAGTHTATLKVQSEDGYMVEVPLSATSQKVTPAITWKENLTPMSRGENVTNPATSPVALTYSSSDPTVVKVEGNVLKPLKKGNATITASFDGTSDLKWNSASSTIDVEVTDMHVQHINWPQTFTRLKYTTDPALSDKNTADFPLTATVSYYDLDNEQEVVLDRTITFTSGNNNVVTVLSDNILHVVGLGETTLTAHVDGVADEYLEATITRTVKVREPSTDCDTYIIEDQSASMATGVTSFNGEQTIIDLQGKEPGFVTFSAWREIIRVLGVDYTGGDLYLAQMVNGQWSGDLWNNGLEVDNPKDFGPIALDRHATKIKLYKKTGSLGIHAFSDCNVTLARYLELDNTEGKTSTDIYFSTTDAKPGVAKTKSFTVNYSNITDQLVVDYEGSDKFSVTPTTIGEECGDKGNATVQVTFLSNDVAHYEGTLTIHNENQSVTVHLSADVDKHHQQITWNPATLNLETTDDVTFDATTSGSSAGLSVRYSVTEGEDVATVDAATGKLTIIKDGDVTVQADADGDGSKYKNADPVSKTFRISKVTPTITTNPTATTMTMPNTSLADCELIGGAASVEGSFAWADNTINATYNNTGYTVTFTPKNTNWYSTTSCVVVVPVNKMVQTITWNFTELEIYPNAQITFDASTNAGLPVSYSSSDDAVAYVDGDNKLLIIRGGEVTITASQSGNETYAAAEPVSKTLTINRFAPTIVTLPNASTMKIGRSLSDASLTGGRAELNGEKVEGSFAWVDGNTTVMDVAGTFSKQIVFNPANSNYYEPVYDQKSVTVEKYAPEISHTLQGSDITYGQPLSASNLSGSLTATDMIKIPSVEVEGTYAWLQPSAVLNAGSQTATVRFTPANMDWYDYVDFDVPVLVNKATVLNPTAAAEIIFGQSLAYAEFESTTLNPQTDLRIDGTVSLAAYLDQNACYTEGIYELPMLFRADDENYTSEPVEGVAILTVIPGIVFNGTNGVWNDGNNWLGGVPDGDDRVTIDANVDVVSNVTVSALTINAGKTVTIKNGATLTVGANNSFNRETYGNIHVEEGGKLFLTSGRVGVNNLYLDASLGNNTIPANSGQIRNPQQIDVNGDAYFDLRLDPVKCSYGWYDFTVPFPVDNRTGISRFQNGAWNTALKTEQHYAIMTYYEDIRANGQYGWKKYYGIMQPGKCYTITVDNTAPLYRFRKVNGADFNTSNTVALTATDGTGGVVNKGWNCIGNGTLTHTLISSAENYKVQIYDHANNSYGVLDDHANYEFPVGTAVFVQTNVSTNLVFTDVNTIVAEAPMRTQGRTLEEYLLTFGRENDAINQDRLYLSASEDAENVYEIGHDLAKFGTSTTVAQIWADAYGQKLCDVEAPLVDDQAIIPISLYAAQTGTYTLETVRGPQDASLYLMYNGAVIWNLSQSAYTFDLTRGTTTGYSLLLTAEAPSITTGVDAMQHDNNQAEKIILNGQLYILRDGQMYDATGKKVK